MLAKTAFWQLSSIHNLARALGICIEHCPFRDELIKVSRISKNAVTCCHAGGREFESRPSRHFKSRKFKDLRLFLFLNFASNPVSTRFAGFRCPSMPVFKALTAEYATVQKPPKLAFCWCFFQQFTNKNPTGF